MTIRAAHVADAAAIASVYAQSWRETYTGLIPQRIIEARTAIEARRAEWNERLGHQRPDDIIFVSEEDGAILGLLWIAPAGATHEHHGLRGEYLYALYVLAKAHGRGIGRELLDAGARLMLSHGRSWLSFDVLATNPARAFYEHLGAQYVSTRTIQDGADRWEQCTYEWPDIGPLVS